jgi:hypothetical protein
MFEIPTGKALLAVEKENTNFDEANLDEEKCKECTFQGGCIALACNPQERKDGKNVIFRLADLPEQNATGIAEEIVRCEERHEKIVETAFQKKEAGK